MLKPQGEVSQAYNLQVEMKVNDEHFTEIQASPNSFIDV